MSSLLRTVRLVHPFPSFVNAALVLGMALLAGGAPARAALLAAAMLGLQLCIGAVNDLCDEGLDARSKPWKPIPSGLVSRRTARRIAIAAGGGGLVLAATVDPVVLLLAAVMLSAGLAYDALLKPTAWAWACFAVAFPLLPVYAWYGAVGGLPPRPEFLLPLAALAGPALQLSNGLADLESDLGGGIATLATRLGRRTTLLVIGWLLAVIHGLAWLTLSASASEAVLPLIGFASFLAALGLTLSAADAPRRREIGWMIQASSIALLGLGWVAALTPV
jgi:4-hydroxybenzoate polyprenyltransferase